MPNYAFTYYGEPKFANPEQGAEYRKKWMAWAGNLGKALTSVTPLGKPRTVSFGGVSDGGGPNRLTGYSIVTAENMEAALTMARGCPHLEHGTVDVSEVMEMKM
jgi:hypothetical protein